VVFWIFLLLFLLIIVYLLIGLASARNILLRMKARWPSLPLEGVDVAFAVFLGGLLWPVGWPTSFTAGLPGLRSYGRDPRPRTSRIVNDWAERTLARKEIVP